MSSALATALDRPTFLLLGAGKAGTTSLSYYLAQHPEIYLSYPKEPPFFQAEYERGMEYYWRTYFHGYRGQRHAFEAAHHNLRLPYVTARIAESLPGAKLLVICRNPVERALSAYWHNVTRRSEARPFEDAIDENLERLKGGPLFLDESDAPLYAAAAERQKVSGAQVEYASYLDSGHYAEHIERFRGAFGADRVQVLFFDDLVTAPQAVADEVFEFLELEPCVLKDTSAQNAPISPGLASVFKRILALPGLGSLPDSWRARGKRLAGKFFRSEKPRMSETTRARLIEYFRPHNRRLEELTGRDLSHWA